MNEVWVELCCEKCDTYFLYTVFEGKRFNIHDFTCPKCHQSEDVCIYRFLADVNET